MESGGLLVSPIGEGKSMNDKEMISFYVERDKKRMAERAARKDRRSLSSWFRIVLDKALEEKE